jgi:hypothetical protein
MAARRFFHELKLYIGRRIAHFWPRRIEDPPTASATARGARRRRKAAHTLVKPVNDAVFHAPMFTLNADANRNACEPNHTGSAPTECAHTFRRGYMCARTHAHACTYMNAHVGA